jgi:hypothetical protein
MQIKPHQRNDLHKLFEYWTRVGANTPYFFPVSLRTS